VSRMDLSLAHLSNEFRSQFNFADWEAFQSRFALEDDCVAFLFQAKWPNGFSCPRCSHSHASIINSRRLPLYQCYGCRHQTSLTVGTIMENSRTPMSKWLSAFYLVSRTDSYLNAMQLKERIRVTYKTAWAMLHAIRQAISNADSENKLSGMIKGSIGFCGKLPYSSTFIRHPQEKPVIFSASVDENGQPTSLKMKVVHPAHMNNKRLDRKAIRDFINRHVQEETVIEEVEFYQRFSTNKILSIKKLFDQTMYRFTKSFRGLSSRHLQLYLDEATYRINLKIQNIPIFNNLTQVCMSNQRSEV
jgi:transposase-like protein